jgi:hypothetical protein
MTKKEFLKIIENVPDDAEIELYYNSKYNDPVTKVVVKTCFVKSTTTITLK